MRTVNVSKCVCGRGSIPGPAGGAYSAPQTLSLDYGRGMERARDGNGMEGGDEKKGRGEGRGMEFRGNLRYWQ